MTRSTTFDLLDYANRVKWSAPIAYVDAAEARRGARFAHAHYVFGNDVRVRVRFQTISRL